MKISLSEYEGQVALAHSLPLEARKTMLATLDKAEVHADGNPDQPVKCKVIQGSTPEAPKPTATSFSTEQVEEMVNKAVAAATAKTVASAAPFAPHVGNKSGIPDSMRRITPKNFHGVKDGRDARERAYRFGMWACATMDLKVGRHFTKWAEHECESLGIDIYGMEQKVMSGSVNTSGGFLIPEEFSSDIIDLRELYGVSRKWAHVYPMKEDTLNISRRSGDVTAAWTSEGGQITESNNSWDQVKLVTKDLAAIARYTNQLSADAMISIADNLAARMSWAFTKAEDDAMFNGDGTSTYGGIVGIRAQLKTLYGTGGGVGLKVGPTSSGSDYVNFTLASFESVLGLLPQYADVPGKVAWFVHKSFYHGTMERLLTAGGGNTLATIQEGSAHRYSFLGYPVAFSQLMPKTVATSQVVALLGNLDQAVAFGDRQRDSVAMSDSAYVNGQSCFERNEMAIRATERVDINVHDYGDANNPGPVVGLETST